MLSFKSNEVYTITFCDVGENHTGMKRIGQLSDSGFDLDDLNKVKEYFEGKGLSVLLFDLKDLVKDEKKKVNKEKQKDKMKDDEDDDDEDEDDEKKEKEDLNDFNDAYFLVIKNGLSAICDPKEFHKEQKDLKHDKKAFMYGRVVNKTARHNLCFADGESSEPNYEKGKGRVYSFKDCPLLDKTRQTLNDILGEKANGLVAEGNYYYDISKCGIGWHGDAERRKVIGVRTGNRMRICFNWFIDSKSIGKKFEHYLDHGDIYVMSEYAVGFNWKKKKIPTLRHSAGSSKFTMLP